MCLSIDGWMQDLFVPDLSPPLDLAWVMQRVGRCEARIWTTAAAVARQGLDVILDLGCMKAADRQRFARQAEEESLQLRPHFVSAELETRRQRVATRNTERGDTFAFQVSPAMFALMESRYEAPNEQELSGATVLLT